LAVGLTACSRAPQDASDHSVPTSASATIAIGSAEIGRISDRTKARGSMVGISATNHSTAAIATPEVDHGSRIAISTASRSILNIRAAGSCRADQITESKEAPGSLLMASVILDPLRLAAVPQNAVYDAEQGLANLQTSFRGAQRTTWRPYAPENLEIPGSALRAAPE
jgi:hypothetical protein